MSLTRPFGLPAIMSVKFYSDDEEDEITANSESSEFHVVGRDSVIFAIECCEGEKFMLWN